MTVPSAQAPAEAFVAALATRDYDAMAATMHSDIAFRALLPSRIAEHANAAAVINEMRGWFERAGCESVATTPWCPTSLSGTRRGDGRSLIEGQARLLEAARQEPLSHAGREQGGML